MSVDENQPGTSKLPSLLDEAAPAARPAPVAAAPSGSNEAAVRGIMRRLRAAEDRKWLRRVAIVALVVMVCGAGVWGAITLWPRPVPDYLDDPMDEILDYTLISGEFNQLPLDRRLGLIKDLIHRLKTMSGQDSALMAAFAATLKEKALKQLQENAKRLAVDMLDSYAAGYRDVPPEERGEFMDQKILEFTRLMEDLSGEQSGLPEDPDERLAALRRQAKKDEEMMQRGDRKMRADRVTNFVKFLQEDSEKIASPVQQARMTRFTRDMVRHLRGETISAPPAPPTSPSQEAPADPGPGGGG